MKVDEFIYHIYVAVLLLCMRWKLVAYAEGFSDC